MSFDTRNECVPPLSFFEGIVIQISQKDINITFALHIIVLQIIQVIQNNKVAIKLKFEHQNQIYKSKYPDSTNLLNDGLEGGYNQEWKDIIEKICQKYVEHKNLYNVDMGELRHVISKINRFDCPIKLSPEDSTFLDVAIWAYFQKRLSLSTIEKRLRYARFMENHEVSVNFRDPSYKNFRQHMDYREEIEKATPHALNHEWKTMRMFLEAYNIPIWPYKPPYAPKPAQRILPFPDTVKQFFKYKYSKNEYENTLFQYIFYQCFMIGWRTPSEICEMKTSDVIIDSNGRGSVTITETKKHRDRRVILPERHILSSRSHKSLKNWIEVWRPRVENRYSDDALFLWRNGRPVTARKLGQKLSKYGKEIWPHFRPYDTRHWCAVARLIESKVQDGHYDPYSVKNWLGHTNIKVTETYIHYAEMYYKQFPKSWIHYALRSHKNVSGQHKETEEFAKIAQLSPQFSPVERVWARQIPTVPTGEISSNCFPILL